MKNKILIVDDDDSIRISLKLLLEKKYTPIAVKNGEEALKKITQTHFDAVLLDIKMGQGIDGLEALELIRKKYNKLIIIMLSAITDSKVINKAIKLGANDYLNKPYSKDEILSVLSNNLHDN